MARRFVRLQEKCSCSVGWSILRLRKQGSTHGDLLGCDEIRSYSAVGFCETKYHALHATPLVSSEAEIALCPARQQIMVGIVSTASGVTPSHMQQVGRVESTWENGCEDKCDYKGSRCRSKQDLSKAKSLTSTSYSSSLINSPGHNYFVK